MSEPNFCCEQMRFALESPEIPLVYTRKFREFGIRILDGGSSKLGITYCPWCGQKLPDSLRDLWFDELERLGIDPAGENVPVEFSDERWYKERGIS
jgi:hypothetical protein